MSREAGLLEFSIIERNQSSITSGSPAGAGGRSFLYGQA